MHKLTTFFLIQFYILSIFIINSNHFPLFVSFPSPLLLLLPNLPHSAASCCLQQGKCPKVFSTCLCRVITLSAPCHNSTAELSSTRFTQNRQVKRAHAPSDTSTMLASLCSPRLWSGDRWAISTSAAYLVPHSYPSHFGSSEYTKVMFSCDIHIRKKYLHLFSYSLILILMVFIHYPTSQGNCEGFPLELIKMPVLPD